MNIDRSTKSFLNKSLITLFSSQITSTLGDIFYHVAIGFWVYQETGSMSLMSLLASISLLVHMVLNPVGGVIVDRLNRKKLLIFGDVFQSILMISVGLIAMNGHLSMTWVFVVAFFVSLSGSFYSPAILTIMLDLVENSKLVKAQSSFSGLNNLMRLIGKGLSGFLVVSLGVPLMIILNGCSNLLAAILLSFLKVPIKHDPNERISMQTVLTDLIEGAKLSFSLPGLNLLLICGIAANLLGAGYLELLIPISFIKGLSEIQYGLFTMSTTAASLLAALLLNMIEIKVHLKMKLFMTSFFLSTIFTISALLSYGFLFFTLSFFIAEFFSMIGNTLLMTTIMLAAPDTKRATIFGFLSSFTIGGTAFSTLVYGLLADQISIIMISVIGTVLAFIALIPLFISADIKRLMLRDAP